MQFFNDNNLLREGCGKMSSVDRSLTAGILGFNLSSVSSCVTSDKTFPLFFFFFKINVYLLFERERETEHERDRGTERETQNLKQAPGSEL